MEFKIFWTILVMNCCTLYLGLQCGWGFQLPYIASYLRLTDPGITLNVVNSIEYAIFVSEIVVIVCLEKSVKVFGLKLSFTLSILIFGIASCLGYFSTNIWQFYVIIFFMGFGFLSGGIYNGFIMIALMPDNVGLSNFWGGFGQAFTNSIYAMMIKQIINPSEIQASIYVEEGENLVAYFTDEVANNIPIFFLILGILTSSFGILAHFTIEDKTNTKNLIKEHITSFSGDNSDVSQEALNVNIIGYDNLNTSAMARRQSAKLNTSQGLDNSMNNYFRKDVSLRSEF